MNYDFTEVDKIILHPVYAWMRWFSVLNPSIETFETLKTFIEEAYGFSKEKFSKKQHRKFRGIENKILTPLFLFLVFAFVEITGT